MIWPRLCTEKWVTLGFSAIWQHGHPWNANGGQARPGERIEKATEHFGVRSDEMKSACWDPHTIWGRWRSPPKLLCVYFAPRRSSLIRRLVRWVVRKRRSEQIKASGRGGEESSDGHVCVAAPHQGAAAIDLQVVARSRRSFQLHTPRQQRKSVSFRESLVEGPNVVVW